MKPQAIKAGVSYFALVFGAGFVLGARRVPFLVPRLGERLAELIEMPFMLLVIVWAARFITQKLALPARMGLRLGVGVLALGLLLCAEFLFAAVLQDRSLGQYIASRDPVSGGVYLGMLLLFSVMPVILGRLAH